MSPYILAKHKPPPETCADIAETLDVFLSFWRPGKEKVKPYLLDRNLSRSDEAQRALFETLMYPSTWNEEMTPEDRRRYICRSVQRSVRRSDARDRGRETDLATNADQLSEKENKLPDEQGEHSERGILNRLAIRESRNRILSQVGLTERDLLVLDLIFFQGYSATEAAAVAGGPGLSPYIAVKSKLVRRKIPQELS